MAKKASSTHEKRREALKALDGEYNGWWIYHYYRGILGGNEVNDKLKRR
tara:strand:- start:1178 stop:1324 length:147 start_codon:yes stop_codon:yes gene_type:complete